MDLDTEVVLSARIHHGTQPDSGTLLAAVMDAQINLVRGDSDAEVTEVAADKGYHSNQQIADCTALGVTTYIPEPASRHERKWTDKPDDVKQAVLKNRRRTRRAKGRRLQRLRSERVERSFAHVCETGGARRTWLRGLEKINKRYSMVVAAHNLGLVMRKLFGSGKPRQSAAIGAIAWLFSALLMVVTAIRQRTRGFQARLSRFAAIAHHKARLARQHGIPCSSTGC